MDLRNCELNGRPPEDPLPGIGIAINDNAVGLESRPSMVSSGRRLGTPAFAPAGFGTTDFRPAADIIAGAPLPSFDDGAANLRDRISALADKFPLYRGLLS